MCCFFRTTVTSFCVKSHSRNSHLCVEEPVWSRAGLWYLTRNHINSSGTYKIQKNLPGHWSDLGDVQFIIAGCRSFGSSGNVCWHEASSVSSFVLFVELQNGCYKVGCAAGGGAVIFHPRCTSTRWTLVVFDRSQVSVWVSQWFFFFFSVVFCRKV